MKILKPIISIIFFITICILAYQIIDKSVKNQVHKKDYAELNNFKYGLFSVDTWKAQLSDIITDEIDKLYLTRRNEKTLKSHLETQLGILIDKVAIRIKQSSGTVKKTFIEAFIDIDDIKKGIPEYANAIMHEITTSKTESQLKGMLKARIDTYMKNTFDVKDDSKKDVIVLKTGKYFEEDAKAYIEKKINRNHDQVVELSMILVVLAVLLFVMEAFNKGPVSQLQYFILTFTLIVLLTVGVTTPMIDMEAKISSLKFVLFDHPIEFENQVMYFQSKSILDVFWIMIKHKDIQMKFVGILMVGFSIVFPILKMLSSLAYYYNYCEARKYKVINFFVLQSGKWSMADVLVVAIFMAYIGFNGILNTQLEQISKYSEGLDIITTNGTSLQPGFYTFLVYTILAMFLSGYLKSRPRDCV